MRDLNLILEQGLSFLDGEMFRSSCLDPLEWSNHEISAYRLLWQTVCTRKPHCLSSRLFDRSVYLQESSQHGINGLFTAK